MPRSIEMDNKRKWRHSAPGDPDKIEIPEPVLFQESQDDLEVRVRELVGKVTVARDLRKGHHSIRRLLEKDDERREKQKNCSYVSSFDQELFASPFERRRLRIVNAIFQRLGRCGVRATIRGKDPESFEMEVGEQHLSFTLDHPDIRRFGSRHGDELTRPSSLPLRLAIESWKKAENLQYTWNDDSNGKLESHLTDIVVTMVMAGELRYRLYECANREWVIERKARLIEAAKQREEESKRQQEEDRRCVEQARVERLLTEAEEFEKARAIREYVASAIEYIDQPSCSQRRSDIHDWAVRALAEADRIDPILSGAFLLTPEDIA